MKNYTDFEEKIEKKFSQKDKKKARKMKVTGKQVFELKKIITEKGNPPHYLEIFSGQIIN